MRIVIVSGGFDPIHSGHIEHFKEAKKLGDILIVGLNSDEWEAFSFVDGVSFISWDNRINELFI